MDLFPTHQNGTAGLMWTPLDYKIDIFDCAIAVTAFSGAVIEIAKGLQQLLLLSLLIAEKSKNDAVTN